MPLPLSMDLRNRILEAKQNKEGTNEELAARFKVGKASISRLWRRHRETGSLAPTAYVSGPPPKLDADGLQTIEALMQQEPDLTQEELAERYQERTGQAISARTAGRARAKLGWTRKKSRRSPKSESASLSSSTDAASLDGSAPSTPHD